MSDCSLESRWDWLFNSQVMVHRASSESDGVGEVLQTPPFCRKGVQDSVTSLTLKGGGKKKGLLLRFIKLAGGGWNENPHVLTGRPAY